MRPARTVGPVTIGQAPRPDLMEEYERAGNRGERRRGNGGA